MADNPQVSKKQKKKKPQRLKARQPRGFVDRGAADIRATDEMVAKIREVYELYGFDPVETPMLNIPMHWGNFCRTPTVPMKGCSRFKMMTSNG